MKLNRSNKLYFKTQSLVFGILFFSFLILSLILPLTSVASTYVGNGGNAGDVELEITLNQIKNTVYELRTDKEVNNKFCRCIKIYSNDKMCKNIEDLSKEQIKFCNKSIASNLSNIEKLIQSKKINYSWTNDNIETHDENTLRSSDAVSDVKNMKMTLNQKRFRSLTASERVFLVSHELIHFLKINSKKPVDDKPIGPFKEKNGGRVLINAMAASVAMNVHEYYYYKEYASDLERSQNWKNHWLNIDTGTIDSNTDSQSPYIQRSYDISNFSYNYFLTKSFGLTVDYTSLKGERDVLSSTSSIEDLDVMGLGLSYRVFTHGDPLTFWGQSFFLINLRVNTLDGDHELRDSFIGFKTTSKGTGGTLECKYYMPIKNNIWFTLGYRVQQLNYEFEKTDLNFKLKYDKVRTGANIGVSYAF